MLVKLQRPPPEINIFLPTASAWSSNSTRRPRCPATAAHSSPAAPAPSTMATSLAAVMATSVQLRDRQPAGLGDRLPRCLPASQRLGNGLQRNTLLGQHDQHLHLGGGRGQLVASDKVRHYC